MFIYLNRSTVPIWHQSSRIYWRSVDPVDHLQWQIAHRIYSGASHRARIPLHFNRVRQLDYRHLLIHSFLIELQKSHSLADLCLWEMHLWALSKCVESLKLAEWSRKVKWMLRDHNVTQNLSQTIFSFCWATFCSRVSFLQLTKGDITIMKLLIKMSAPIQVGAMFMRSAHRGRSSRGAKKMVYPADSSGACQVSLHCLFMLGL